jgi:hypothetical protein
MPKLLYRVGTYRHNSPYKSGSPRALGMEWSPLMNVFHPQRIRGRILAGGLLLGAISTAGVAAGPAAFASPSSAVARSVQAGGGQVVTWSVSPASATAPDYRSVFSYTSIKPGSTIYDHVAVFNRSKQSVAFLIYATDATGTTQGNVLELLPPNKKPHDIGSWVTLAGGVSQLSIVIPADKGIIEAFKLAVPRHATPGDHTGGMMVAVSFPRKTSKGSVVVENQRIGIPIELRVTGPLRAGLRVESVSTGFHSPLSPFSPGSATVSYSVLNVGNVRLTGSQSVSVTGPFGISSKVRLNNLPTVLPGDSIRFTTKARGLYPLGPMTAHVSLTPSIPPGAPLMALPAGSVTGTASLFAVPWTLILLAILLIGAAYAGWRGRGWQRRRLRARLDAVAEGARRETEKRLLGNKGTAAGPQQQA